MSVVSSGKLGSTLIGGRINAPSNKVIAKVHDDYHLYVDGTIREAWEELNKERRNNGYLPIWNSTVYRLTSLPNLNQNNYGHYFEFDLLPIDFIYKVLLADNEVTSNSVKRYITEKIEIFGDGLPAHLTRYDKSYFFINKNNYIPLGTEVTIITNDHKVLLRKRGLQVVDGKKRWDTSVSGYCTSIHIFDKRLHFGLTASEEVNEEIGPLSGNLVQEIIWTGLHYNGYNSFDMLGFWQAPISSRELGELLARHSDVEEESYPGAGALFKTKRRIASEPFVWDYLNLIVDFDGDAINHAINTISPAPFAPEALASIIRALESTNREVGTLPQPAWTSLIERESNSNNESPGNKRGELRRKISSSFSLNEVKAICFDLYIPYQDLEGITLETKVISLIEYCERREMVGNLIDKLKHERPNIPWENLRK